MDGSDENVAANLKLKGETEEEWTTMYIPDLQALGRVSYYFSAMVHFHTSTHAAVDDIHAECPTPDPRELEIDTGKCSGSVAAQVATALLAAGPEADVQSMYPSGDMKGLEVTPSNAAALLCLSDQWCCPLLRAYVVACLRNSPQFCNRFSKPDAAPAAPAVSPLPRLPHTPAPAPATKSSAARSSSRAATGPAAGSRGVIKRPVSSTSASSSGVVVTPAGRNAASASVAGPALPPTTPAAAKSVAAREATISSSSKQQESPASPPSSTAAAPAAHGMDGAPADQTTDMEPVAPVTTPSQPAVQDSGVWVRGGLSETVPQVYLLLDQALGFGLGDADGELATLQADCLTWMVRWARQVLSSRELTETVPRSALARLRDHIAEATVSGLSPQGALKTLMDWRRLASSLPPTSWARPVLELALGVKGQVLEYVWSHWGDVAAAPSFSALLRSAWGQEVMEEVVGWAQEHMEVASALRNYLGWPKNLLHAVQGPEDEAQEAGAFGGGSMAGTGAMAVLRELYQLLRQYLLRNCAAVMRSPAFKALSAQQQQHIMEAASAGIKGLASNAVAPGTSAGSTPASAAMFFVPVGAEEPSDQRHTPARTPPARRATRPHSSPATADRRHQPSGSTGLRVSGDTASGMTSLGVSGSTPSGSAGTRGSSSSHTAPGGSRSHMQGASGSPPHGESSDSVQGASSNAPSGSTASGRTSSTGAGANSTPSGSTAPGRSSSTAVRASSSTPSGSSALRVSSSTPQMVGNSAPSGSPRPQEQYSFESQQ